MKRLLRHVSRILPALLAVGLAAFVLRSADLARVLALVGSLGAWLPLLVLPNFAVTLIEAVAWWRSFSLLGPRPPFVPLVGVRVVAEAVMLGLPSGAVISESLQPYLLKRRCGVPFESAVVATVGRKFFVVVSHALVLAVATLFAWPVLARVSRETVGRPGLPWALLAVSAFMFATFGVGLALSGRARIAQRTRVGLDRVGGRWLGSWLERHTQRFQRADDDLVRFFEGGRPALVLPLLLYSAGWLLRGGETWLFLRLLGADASYLAALVVESAIVVVRSVAVPVPAGLGIQDMAYVLSFRALGVPDAVTLATAFVVLKRGKDLFWILLGFALMAVGERSASRPAASAAGSPPPSPSGR
ncbi:MAG TPA: lysylphosphatidylglycerol synthase domain-containing protein [Vicinamibacteria bacterium]|nr:lysylphosphatidylglycerol synthase domain-containing protein [Vicinamibacteria bacterium]